MNEASKIYNAIGAHPEHGVILQTLDNGYLASYKLKIYHGGFDDSPRLVLEFIDTEYVGEKS